MEKEQIIMKYKRIFVIVMDSAGIGALPDADKFGDAGTNTWVHISERNGGLNVPTLNSLGIGDLAPIIGTTKVSHPNSIVTTLREASNGKDTMTGHWEMMGIKTEKPFKTFTDTGFPKELMDELSEKTGRKLIGNKAASGTEILVELGEQQMKEGSLIVYTSADSVLQIAAHEEVIPVPELYKYCEIAREICNRPEYRLGRIIARPFIGNDKTNFKRTPNRHDLALSPTGRTAMDDLKDAGYETSCVGKISDIFNNVGVTRTVKTVSNSDGMQKTLDQVKDLDFTGLCFTNLVDFDALWGHRRNPQGYAEELEKFDVLLGQFLEKMKEDDLVIVTADHGNDPTFKGTDHTKERVPFLAYSPSMKTSGKIDDQNCFAVIGATIADNFGAAMPKGTIGTSILKQLE